MSTKLSPDSSAGLERDLDTSSADLLSLVLRLTASRGRTESVDVLFQSAFEDLADGMRFDVAIGLVLEQTIDVYISRCSACDSFPDSALIEKIRETLQTQLAVPFDSADIVVRADQTRQASSSDSVAQPLSFVVQTVLRQSRRTAGLLMFFRGDTPFTEDEEKVVNILANHVSMLLEQTRVEVTMQTLADTDDLTGIWNRRYFRRHLPSEVDRARIYAVPLSLLMVDLDDFKQVNDRFGHSIGDVLISEVCGTIRGTLRPPDLFARVGGDEFAIVLPHTDAEGARSVADRIVQRVRQLEIFSEDIPDVLKTSVSLGGATLSEKDETPVDLLNRADEQLYLSKRNGKDRYSS